MTSEQIRNIKLKELANEQDVLRILSVARMATPSLGFVDSTRGLLYCRIGLYEREYIQSDFSPDKFHNASELLTEYLSPFLEPVADDLLMRLRKKQDVEFVNHSSTDYRGSMKRTAIKFVNNINGVNMYVMAPTDFERKTAVIPFNGDELGQIQERSDRLLTVQAWKDNIAIKSFLSNGNFYTPVNDFGTLHSAHELRSDGGYNHHDLNKVLAFLRSPKGTSSKRFLVY